MREGRRDGGREGDRKGHAGTRGGMGKQGEGWELEDWLLRPVVSEQHGEQTRFVL